MTTSTKVSIQIPTYNQEDYIAAAIESALMQDYDNIEIIVADDCSTDNTQGIIKKFEHNPKVKYFRNKKNLGRVANYHKALYEYCTGDWVVNLDGDDYFIAANFISEGISQINNYPGEKIVIYQGNHNLNKLKKVFGDCTVINDTSILVDGASYFINYFKVQNFTHCATLFKRAEALKLNFYSFNALSCDFNSMLKLLLKGKIIASGNKVAEWRIHNNNQSAGLNQKKINIELDSVKNIAGFARPFFEESVIVNWEKKMIAFFRSAYIESLIRKPAGFTSLRYIVRHFSFDYVYFRQLIKYLVK